MRLKPKHAWFLAFTAVFAALAGFVFWGTWSTSVCPVMPDSPMVFPEGSAVGRYLRAWVSSGLFIPYDIRHFIGSSYLWQEIQYVLGVYCSGLGLAYYLKGRGVSNLAAYGAGLFLAFCGYWITLFSAGHGGWFHWMLSGVFAFGLVDRAVRKNKMKNWVLLGACLAWGCFYQPDLWFLFTFFTSVYFLWCCIRERKFPAWRGVFVAAIVFSVIGSPGFVGALGAKEFRDKQIAEAKGSSLTGGANAADQESRWIFVTNWSLPPAEIAEFFISRLNGDTSCNMVLGLGRRQGRDVRPYTGALGRPFGAKEGNYRQHSLYVGWVTCLCALIAVAFLFAGRRTLSHSALYRDRRDIVFFGCAAFVFCLLSMGRYCEPLYRIVFALPVGDSLRAPVKWHHLTELCLCILAGFGLDAVFRYSIARGCRARTVGAILCVFVLWGACDLARCARLYCAVIDLSIVQAPNPAVELVKKRGGGKVADLLEGGNGFAAWSFTTRGIAMTGNLSEEDIRFIWAPVRMLNEKRFGAWLKERGAVPIGTFLVTSKAIRISDGRSANAMLMEIPGRPAAPADAPVLPPMTVITWLGILSLAGTVGTCAYVARKV